MRFLALAALLFATQAEAAITFVACAATDIPVATRTWTVNQPSVTNGDVLIYAFVASSASSANGTPPTGVSLILEQGATTDADTAFFRKVASGEGATLEFTTIFAALETGLAVVCAYRGVDNTTPMDAAAVSLDSGGNVTSLSGPSITSVTANAWILQIAATDPAGAWAGTDDASPDATQRFDDTDTSEAEGYVFWQDYELASAGPLALDITALNNDAYAYAQLALRPAAGGGGGSTAVSVIRQVNP